MGKTVSPSFHANFAQKHVNTFSLLILHASYQHHQKHGNTRTSALCCLRTAKWANPEGCAVKRRLTVGRLGMLPESRAVWKSRGLHLINRNEALLQPTCWAKDILLETSRMNVGWNPFRAGFEEFSNASFHDFQRCSWYTTHTHTQVGQGDGNIWPPKKSR